MAKRRYLNIVIAPEDRSRTLTFRIRLGHFYALAVVLSVAFVVVVGLVMNQAMDEAKLGELELLRHQNIQLKEKVARIATLEKKITELEIVEDKLMIMAGEREAARELAPVSVEGGKGGTSKPTSIAESLLQFRNLATARRGVIVNAPVGDPVAGGWIARGFGETGLEGSSFHAGVDIACPQGTPVVAAAAGVVTFAGVDPVYGKLVIIQHGLTGYSTLYGHNRDVEVRVGQLVNKGDVIARVGSTGKSSAPHLHYEVRLHGVPVNPAKYLTAPETGGEEEAPPTIPEEKPATAAPSTGEKEPGGIPGTGEKRAPAPPGPSSPD